MWLPVLFIKKTVLDGQTLNAIGKCIVWLLRLKIKSLSVYWSLCEKFCLFTVAKCQAVWKMIVLGQQKAPKLGEKLTKYLDGVE